MLQMTNSNLKYLIAGTGGVGGSIAAFLSLSGKDVTCIARGEHLAAIHEHGLRLHSDLKGEHTLKIPAYTTEEYTALASSSADFKADVIFVCVKGYSVDSITELIKCTAHKDTAGSRCNGIGRLHLHRRICFRQRRDHTDGKDIPPGLRSTQKHNCSS